MNKPNCPACGIELPKELLADHLSTHECVCETCGSIVPALGLYCDQCGDTLGQACSHCGGVNRPIAKSCRHCGRSLVTVAPNAETPSQTEPGPTTDTLPSPGSPVAPMPARPEPSFPAPPQMMPLASPPTSLAPPASPSLAFPNSPTHDDISSTFVPRDARQVIDDTADDRGSEVEEPVDEMVSDEPADFTEDAGSVDDLVSHHMDELKHYVALWFDDAMRSESQVTLPEAGYSICMHAASLKRFTGNERVLSGLLEFDVSERLRIARATCDFMQHLGLDSTAESVLRDDLLDAEQLDQLEDSLIMRDEVDQTIKTVRAIGHDFSETQWETIRPQLAKVIADLAVFDQQLWERPDVLAVIGEPLETMASYFVDEALDESAWWLTLPGKLRDAEPGLPSAAETAGSSTDGVIDDTGAEATPSGTVTRQLTPPSPGMAIPEPPPSYTLAAATLQSDRQSVYLRASSPQPIRALLLMIRHWVYQIKMLSPQTSEQTDQWNQAELIGFYQSNEVARETIMDGAVVLTASSPIDQIVLKTVGGERVFLIPEQEDTN